MHKKGTCREKTGAKPTIMKTHFQVEHLKIIELLMYNNFSLKAIPRIMKYRKITGVKIARHTCIRFHTA